MLQPCFILKIFSYYMPHILHIIFSFSNSIYSIDTLLYPYTLPLITFPLTSLKSLPKCNLSSCHMQVHSSRNYIPTVKIPPKHTSLPSIVAIFFTTCLMAVLQLSGYSIFHGGDTPIQLGLL